MTLELPDVRRGDSQRTALTYGARDPKKLKMQNPFIYSGAEGGVLGEECAELLTSFFAPQKK